MYRNGVEIIIVLFADDQGSIETDCPGVHSNGRL